MSKWYLPQLVNRVREQLGPEFPVTTEIPPDQSAWVSVPVFGVAKSQGRDVAEVAAEVSEKLASIEGVTVKPTGGFVNIIPTDVRQILNESRAPDYPTSKVGAGKSIVIDYSHPNIAKRMSVGHLRSTIIGHSLRRLHETLGYTVIGINYLGDWGTQYGKLVVAYQKKYGDLEPRDSVTIQELFELYVKYHADAEGDTELDDQARAMFKRLEDGDEAVTKLWRFFVELSLIEFQKIYDRLDVSFTEPKMGESYHRSTYESVIQSVQTRETSDGAQIVRVPGLELPLMLVKRDGATTYATRDLAALKFRTETYQPEAILYVVSNEQTLHFQQVFAVARLVGIVPESVNLEHIKFGFLRLAEGKMSTRKGRVVFVEDVMDEAVRRAREVVESKNPELDDREKSEIAEVVGIGAMKYFDLSHDRRHDIVFDWDRMLSLKGDSAPYLQYSYVRAANILEKAGAGNTSEVAEGLLRGGGGATQSLSQLNSLNQLVRLLAQFPLVVQRSAEHYTPHTLAQYLNSLATEFNKFYETYPVLQAEGEDRALRLALVAGFANVMRRGLDLLGIKVVDRM